MFEEFLKQLAATSWPEWLGMITGIVGVWLSIKEKAAAWLLFIICYACYVYISYSFGLQSFMVMNAVFIGISAYGWVKWTRQNGEEALELPISRMNKSHWPFVGMFIVSATIGIGWLLGRNGEAQLPYLDAFATSCGFTAQWMLSRKQLETWMFWIITDIIYLGIFFHGDSWPSVILFAVFIGLAIKGWNEWHAVISKEK